MLHPGYGCFSKLFRSSGFQWIYKDNIEVFHAIPPDFQEYATYVPKNNFFGYVTCLNLSMLNSKIIMLDIYGD